MTLAVACHIILHSKIVGAGVSGEQRVNQSNATKHNKLLKVCLKVYNKIKYQVLYYKLCIKKNCQSIPTLLFQNLN